MRLHICKAIAFVAIAVFGLQAHACDDGVNCTGSTPYCSLTEGYCCSGADEYACTDSEGNGFCSTSSTCSTGGGGGGGGGGGCVDGESCTGSTPYCSLTSGYCCSGSGEYACHDSAGNEFCSTSSTCTTDSGGGESGCKDGENCTGETPYCSLTSGYCCSGAGEYACHDGEGNEFCSTSSDCSTGGSGGGDSGCRDGTNCTGATPFCSLTTGYCCASANEYACTDGAGQQFCSANSDCSTGTSGLCQDGVNCTGNTTYCAVNNSGYCCSGPGETACTDGNGNGFCSTSSDCSASSGGGGGGGGGGCLDGINCTGDTAHCSLNNSGYCCAGANEYACKDTNGNLFCSTSASCTTGTGGGSGSGGGGCQSGVNCTGTTPYCAMNNSGYCCAGQNEFACKDGNGNAFCSTSSTCNQGQGTNVGTAAGGGGGSNGGGGGGTTGGSSSGSGGGGTDLSGLLALLCLAFVLRPRAR